MAQGNSGFRQRVDLLSLGRSNGYCHCGRHQLSCKLKVLPSRDCFADVAKVHLLDPPIKRTFPITFDTQGNIVNHELAYPDRGWVIPTAYMGILTFAIPFTVYLIAQIRLRSPWDASSAMLGTCWAIGLATLFQVMIKTLSGGFRPVFLDVCKPDLSRLKDPGFDRSGLNGVGFRKIMYSTDICTQTDAYKLRTAITSFPSGHSAACWAAYGFLFLWLNSKLKVWSDYRPSFLKIVVTMLPILAASINSCILTVDGAHHWYDIMGGSIIGIVMAIAAYRNTYAALVDWRYNHIPLRGKEAFIYGARTVDYSQETLTRKVGWRGRRDWAVAPERPRAVRITHLPHTAQERPSWDGARGVSAPIQYSSPIEEELPWPPSPELPPPSAPRQGGVFPFEQHQPDPNFFIKDKGKGKGKKPLTRTNKMNSDGVSPIDD